MHNNNENILFLISSHGEQYLSLIINEILKISYQKLSHNEITSEISKKCIFVHSTSRTEIFYVLTLTYMDKEEKIIILPYNKEWIRVFNVTFSPLKLNHNHINW